MYFNFLLWIARLFAWVIELLPDFIFGEMDITPLVAMVPAIRPLFPVEVLATCIVQWAAVGAWWFGITSVRLVAKVLAVVRGGAW